MSNQLNGFSYICQNCGHCTFVCTDGQPTEYFRCFRCYTKLVPSAIYTNVNLLELQSEGFDMNIPDQSKQPTWVKLETPPDEIDVINSNIYNFNCPFCNAGVQQFVTISEGSRKVYIFCSSCSTIYYGDWSKQETKEKGESVDGTNS